MWQHQAIIENHKTYVPSIDPTLAQDPSVESAKLKVVGPLANQLQANGDDLSSDSSEGNEVKAARTYTSANVDLVAGFHHLPTVTIFQGQTSVQGLRDVQFEIPPHVSFPRLVGSYNIRGNPRTAGVLLFSEQQFGDYVRNGLGDPVFSNEGCSGNVDVALSPTHAMGQKYHLVFRNAPARRVLAEAKFTLSFE